MGWLAERTKGRIDDESQWRRIQSPPSRSEQSRQESQATWRRVFGPATDKESSQRPRSPQEANNWAATAVDNNTAQKRMLQAFRTNAPGGWPDDRWSETMQWQGVPYIAMHRKAMQMMQAEFAVFVRDDNNSDGKRPIKKGEPGWDLLKFLEKPNKKDTFGLAMYRWSQQMSLTGEALTWLVPNVLASKILEMYCVPTAMAIPQPVTDPQYPEGFYRIQPYYPYGPFSTWPTPSASVGAPIPAQWMMQFQYPHPLLRYAGMSPFQAGRLQVDCMNSMEMSRWSSQLRAIRPNAVVNMKDREDAQDLPQPEVDRIKSDFEAFLQGPNNAGGLLFAPPGGTIDPWGRTEAEMDWVNSWAQMADFELILQGMTKAGVGMESAGSYAEYFASLKQVNLMTLKPDCDMFAGIITMKIGPFFGDDLIVEIRCPRIDDHEVLDKRAEILAQNRAITYNQLLKAMDFPTTEEEWGEERVGMDQQADMAMGMMAGQNAPQGPQPPPLGEGGKEGDTEASFAPEPPEIQKNRPDPGTLNRGSLGPRKSMTFSEINGSLRERLEMSRKIDKLLERTEHLNGNGRRK